MIKGLGFRLEDAQVLIATQGGLEEGILIIVSGHIRVLISGWRPISGDIRLL